MITVEEIKTMPRVDKIRLMEDLWEDLTNEGDYQSPEWHESELRETEERVSSGLEGRTDWKSAKRELRSKFE